MSFTIGGLPWQPRTAAQHAQTMLDRINQKLKDQATTEKPYTPIGISDTNVIWQILLAAGSVQQEFDESLYQAASSFNVSACDDQQLYNLLPISGIAPYEGRRSVVSLTIATKQNQIVIPKGAQVNSDTGDVFTIDQSFYGTITIPANIPGLPLTATSQLAGEIVAPPGSIKSFYNLDVPDGVTIINESAAITGFAEEPPASIRRRLLDQRRSVQIPVNQATELIGSLLGINQVKIFFNPSNTDNLLLPGTGGPQNPTNIVVPPRSAFIVILGNDLQNKIAQSFYKFMNCPTIVSYIGNQQSTVTLLSGSNFVANYKLASPQNVYVNVFYDATTPTASGFVDDIKSTLIKIQSQITIGQTITSAMIDDFLSGYKYANITGSTLSLSVTPASSFDRAVAIDADKFANFSTARINVIGESP